MINTNYKQQIPFKETGFFSKIILDYLAKNPNIEPFYKNYPSLTDFKKQIETKRLFVPTSYRLTLAKVLKEQYKNLDISSKTKQCIGQITKSNTFTITTGHQLNLFTGPLYFLYKILATINLCEQLTAHFPKENFVPIYWMATEDHDFEEINYFNFKSKKIRWHTTQTGAVGRFSTKGLETAFKEFSEHLGVSNNSSYLKKLFSDGYLKHPNLTAATRFIVNELFGKYGLVILDADNVELKREFAPFVKNELLEQTAYNEVLNTNKKLKVDYKIQVNPRPINLFYAIDGLRERIILKNGLYRINNTELAFTEAEILEELDAFPNRFSPNVIMRPLYQEVVLPNLCYVGGGGELAYWLQLKSYFKKTAVTFPILLLRNSIMLLSEKQQKKLNTLQINNKEIFLKQPLLLKKKVTEKNQFQIDFSEQKEFLQAQFSKLKRVAANTDESFIGAVNAQERKQLKGLENLEKKLLRAEKRKQAEYVAQIIKIQNQLFPNQNLEERQRNFSEYYLEYGERFIALLKKEIDPLALEFSIITLL